MPHGYNGNYRDQGTKRFTMILLTLAVVAGFFIIPIVYQAWQKANGGLDKIGAPPQPNQNQKGEPEKKKSVFGI